MSQVLKCNVCNIVIDELLAYVQNKISVIDEETLKRICVSAFTSNEICKSKSLLFESLPTDQRKIIRKRKGKEERDQDDIISVFKSTDPDVIPVFVARMLEKLPPILFDHLDCTKLLKDLTRLNSEVEMLKNSYVPLKQFEDLRADVHNLKHASLPPCTTPTRYVNMRRGAWNMESGPVGKTLSPNFSSHEQHVQQSPGNAQSHNSPVTKIVTDNRQAMLCKPLSQTMHINELPPTTSVPVVVRAGAAPAQAVSCENVKKVQVIQTSIAGSSIPKPLMLESNNYNVIQNDVCQQLESNVQINNENEDKTWQTVNRNKRKQKYRYLGERGKAETTTSSFKAAVKKIPIFITNVHNDTVLSDIVDYIKEKTQETVFLEKVNTKKVLDHKAYKFFVSESKVSVFLDEKVWPEGIIFRRFVHYRHRKVDRESADIGPLLSHYG